MSAPTGGPEHHPWFVHGLIHWLTGVVFAVVLGLLIVGVGPRVPGLGGFLHNVEQRGVDYAMRLRVTLQGADAGDDYVFVDIDAAYCAQVTDEAKTKSKACEWRSPAQPDVVSPRG